MGILLIVIFICWLLIKIRGADNYKTPQRRWGILHKGNLGLMVEDAVDDDENYLVFFQKSTPDHEHMTPMTWEKEMFARDLVISAQMEEIVDVVEIEMPATKPGLW